MAIMIPPDLPDKGTKGERQLFLILKNALSNDYICWYEPELHRRNSTRYPDFVLAGPDIGIIALEVKDWVLNNVVAANPESITFRTPDGREYEAPVEDSCSQMKSRLVISTLTRSENCPKVPRIDSVGTFYAYSDCNKAV